MTTHNMRNQTIYAYDNGQDLCEFFNQEVMEIQPDTRYVKQTFGVLVYGKDY